MKVGPRFLIPVLVGALIAGCGDGGSGSSTTTTSGSTAEVPSQPSGKVTLQKIGEFDQPDYVAQPPGSDDLYVVERPGRIRIVRDGQTLPEPALDIADQVSAEGEQGLLSVAFPPDFESSRLLYVYFTGTDQDQHVVEYSAADDGTVDEGTAREVLRMDDSPPTTTAASSCSATIQDPCTSVPEMAVSPAIRSGTDRTWGPCSGRSSGLTRASPARAPTPHAASLGTPARSRGTTSSSGEIFWGQGPRSATTGCATPGASASTARPARF